MGEPGVIPQEQAGEGCHLYGKLLVNKVAGNFHIAPGKSFQQVLVQSVGSYNMFTCQCRCSHPFFT